MYLTRSEIANNGKVAPSGKTEGRERIATAKNEIAVSKLVAYPVKRLAMGEIKEIYPK